jgi:dihydroorotase
MRFEVGEIVHIHSPIDVHTHLREPGGVTKETINSGTLAAFAGGYQAVFDMPNNPNGCQTWTEARLDEKYEIAERTSNTKIGFYAGVDLENPDFEEIPRMIGKSAGLKLYMGHTTGNTKEHDLGVARPVIDAWMEAASEMPVNPPILLHAREGVGEETADYILNRGYPVHWCHISTDSEVDSVTRLLKKDQENFTSAITPHHLTMINRDADFKYGWLGARMMPPLGREIDAERLAYAFSSGTIQILETDHAPHTMEEKIIAESTNPEGDDSPDCVTCFGISGIEFVLPVMMSLVQRGIITMERLEDSLYYQPARMLQLDISDNKARTILEIGPRILGEDEVVSKSRNNPYVGWTGWAKVRHTYPGFDKGKILKTGSVL